MHWIRIAGLAAGVAAASIAAIGSGKAQDRSRLGFAGALSGPASFVGVEIKRGAEIAIDEINAKGGIKGRKLVLDLARRRAQSGQDRRAISRAGRAREGRWHHRRDQQRLDARGRADRQRHT